MGHAAAPVGPGPGVRLQGEGQDGVRPQGTHWARRRQLHPEEPFMTRRLDVLGALTMQY